MEQMPIGVMLGVGENPEERLARVKQMNIPTVQMGCPPQQWWRGDNLKRLKKAIGESGITVTTVFMGFGGESYADIPTVRKTVGLVPPETRAPRLETALKIVDFADAIGVKRAAAHIGFVPEDQSDPLYAQVIEAARKVADRCKSAGMVFALETGQETGPTLKRFIGDVQRDNMRVNFDPANMILYGSGEPIAALKLVGQWVDGVHCKDGRWPTEKDKLGHEVPLGEGEVGIENFVKTLVEIGYRGPLTIEREISGEQQAQDIMKAKTLLEGLRKKYLGCC